MDEFENKIGDFDKLSYGFLYRGSRFIKVRLGNFIYDTTKNYIDFWKNVEI